MIHDNPVACVHFPTCIAGTNGSPSQGALLGIGGGEHHIYPVVGCVVGLRREAAGAVSIDAISTLLTIGKGSQR